jgi:Na+/proline symporter
MENTTANIEIHWVDYTLFGVTLLIPLIIGIYQSIAKGGQKTTIKYLLGNKQMMVVPVSVSSAMSNRSGVMVLGQITEVYLY